MSNETEQREAFESALDECIAQHVELSRWYPGTDEHARVKENADAARAALLRAQQPMPATRPENSQDWSGMCGAVAWHLIDRHADGWEDVDLMMGEWLAANQSTTTPPQGASNEN
jgi:hypothetical protein